MVGELVDDREANLLGQVVGVGEVGLEREPEERDLVRRGDRIGGPFGPGRPLVQAVEAVPAELVVAQLVGAWLVLDDDRDLAEAVAEGRRDVGQGARHEPLEPVVAAGTLDWAGGAAAGTAGLRQGPPILATCLQLPVSSGSTRPQRRRRIPPPSPTVSWSWSSRTTGSTSSIGASRRATMPAPGCCSSTASPVRRGSGHRWPGGSTGRPGRSPSTSVATASRMRRPRGTTGTPWRRTRSRSPKDRGSST